MIARQATSYPDGEHEGHSVKDALVELFGTVMVDNVSIKYFSWECEDDTAFPVALNRVTGEAASHFSSYFFVILTPP
ncbi:MAG TPA: hypothetical protein VEP90_12370 [Methylomirabilota bacterium]|nr:hypothetical protein [Methylomirabilota bacterium]